MRQRKTSRLFTSLASTRNGEIVNESRPLSADESSLRLKYARHVAYDGATFAVAGYRTDAGSWVKCADACREFRRACERLGATQTQCETLGANAGGKTSMRSYYCAGAIKALEQLRLLPCVERMTFKNGSVPRFSTTLAPEATAKLSTESPLTEMYMLDADTCKVKMQTDEKGRETVKTISHRENVARVVGTLPATPRKQLTADLSGRETRQQAYEARSNPGYYMARVLAMAWAEMGVEKPMAVAIEFAGRFHKGQ